MLQNLRKTGKMKSSKYSVTTPRRSLRDENPTGLQSFSYNGVDQLTKDVSVPGYHLKRDSDSNGNSYKDIKQTREDLFYEDEYNRQAYCGIACCRPKSLQFLSKSLWTFIAVYSSCAIWIVSVMIYLNTQIISLQRYFHISSSQMGLLMSAADIGSLVFVLAGGHFGKFYHIPRVLAFSALGIGIIVMSVGLIQAISPVYLPVAAPPLPISGLPKNQTLSMPQMLMTMQAMSHLCVNQPIGMGGMNQLLLGSQGDTVATHWGYYVIFITLFIVGAMASYRIPLQTYYIETNVRDKSHSGIFVGVLATAMLFGSPVSMFLGGAMNEMPVDLKETDMTVFDLRWIGCWWLGFLIIGSCIIVTSLPVFLLPRNIVHDVSKDPSLCFCQARNKAADTKQQLNANGRDKHHTKGIETHATVDKGAKLNDKEDLTSNVSLLDKLKDLPRSLKRVLRNPVVVLVLIEFVIMMCGLNGLMSFQLKYINDQFDISPASISYTLGYGQLAATVIGSMLGGVLTTRLRLTRAGMFKLTFTGLLIGMCSSLSFLLIGCENHSIVGLNKARSQSNLTALQCDCTKTGALFVCGSDGVDYMSPCLAGCQQTNGLSFSNCSLVGGAGLAQPGFCNTECSMFTPFLIMYMVTLLMGALTVAPRMLMLARTVKTKDIAVVVGLNTFMATLGAVLGPLIFGHIYDTTCLLWHQSGAYCLLSDKDDLRFTFLGSEAALRGASFILFVIATIIVHRQQRQETGKEGETVDDKVEMEMTVVDPKGQVNHRNTCDYENNFAEDDDNGSDVGNRSDCSDESYTKSEGKSNESNYKVRSEGDDY